MSANAIIREIADDLRQPVAARKVPLVLTVGLVAGVSVVVGLISLATLAFSGPLAPHASQGVGLVLFGSFATCLVIALGSSFHGAVSAPPGPTMVMLAAIGGSIGATGDQLLPTMVALIFLSSVATGALLILIARARLASLIRFIPYPVSSGFVAGTGGIICLIALSLVGVRPDPAALAGLLEADALLNWGVGVAYGLGLYFATKRWTGFLLMPVSFVLAALLCHLCLAMLGISAEQAEAAGLLFGGVSQGNLWPGFSPSDLARIDWGAVAQQIPNMLTLVLVTIICAVMYIGGLELASGKDLQWNRELGAMGFASLVSGFGGGPPGCPIVPTSLRSALFGVDVRLTGLVAAAVIGATLLFGNAVLKLAPVPLMGGVLLFTGIAMVDQWLLQVRKRIPWTDYAIVLTIFFTILTFGFLEGVGVGMLITVIFFVVRLSRVDLVASRFTARDRRSGKIRPIPDRAILQAQGEAVQAYRLRGYLFFGSSYHFADRLKQSLTEEPRPLCVVLDFEAVSGFDFSTVSALCRILVAARASQVPVLFSAAPERLQSELRRNLPLPAYANAAFYPDLDHALEQGEDLAVATHRPQPGDEPADASLLEAVADDMARQLDSQAQFEELIVELRGWTQPRRHAAGETLSVADEPDEGFMLLTSGRATLLDSDGVRLRQYGPGDLIKPLGAFGAPVAGVEAVAEEPCRVEVLTNEAMRLLEASDQGLALALYRYLLGTTHPRR